LPGAEITIIANVALDQVNGHAWRSGGCPTFSPYVLRTLHARGAIYASCADEDRGYFDALQREPSLTCSFLSAATTSRFTLDYAGDERRMSVYAIGHRWSADDIASLNIQTEWVHLAPLMRTDFPAATVAALAARGHRVSYDGQGLVRAPHIGQLTLDARYDRSLLRSLAVLKLSDEEGDVLSVSGDREVLLAEFSEVPELVLTRGSRGAEIRASGCLWDVAPEHVIDDVQTTGAGDAFMIGYLIGRHRGRSPREAAVLAAGVTAAMLAERKEASVPRTLGG
jgi:sugar/nucleoside kinase (ribokinase family)